MKKIYIVGADSRYKQTIANSRRDIPIFFKAADSKRPALTSGDFEWCILTVLLPIERAWQARE